MATLGRREPLLVKYVGARAGEAPITCGQLSTLDWLAGVTEAFDADLELIMDLPDGTRLSDVADSLAVLLARHESLRTTYRPQRSSAEQLRRGQRPVQVVHASGELTVLVYPLDSIVDDADIAAELFERLREDSVASWPGSPVRAALAVEGEVVRAGVLTCSHLAVDHHAMHVLGRELAGLLRDAGTRQVGEPRHQPLDRAEVEQGLRMRRRAEATVRYLEDRLTRMPQCPYPRPRHDPARVLTADDIPGTSMAVQMVSAAAALALRNVAARLRISRPAIALAAVCALLSHRTGYRTCDFPVMAGNRHERDLFGYVGTIAQTTLASVEVGDAGFDELARRAFAATLNASRHGCYDVYRRMDLTDRIQRDRGTTFNFGPVVNNVVIDGPPPPPVPAEQIAAAQPYTKLFWRAMPPSTPVLRFDLWRYDPTFAFRLYSGDAGRVARTEAEELVQAVERLLIAAAGGDIDRAGMVAAIGIPPIGYGPGCVLVDSCWVELVEVQRLLDDALVPSTARVFSDVDGRALTAFVAASEPVRTPAEAHARCVAAMTDRFTAMAPQWYVVCDGVPGRPDSLDEWRRQPVLSYGSGRPADTG